MREPKTATDKILQYILQFDNLSLADFPTMDTQKRSYIEEKLRTLPSPIEQGEWQAIQALSNTPTQALLDRLTAYINKWGSSLPSGNHVEAARLLANTVKMSLNEQQRQQEETDWNAVDPLSIDSLWGHITSYPNTIYKNEIDDSIWGLANESERVDDIQRYIDMFPAGRHMAEARAILKAIVEWEAVKNTGDIFAINQYARQNSHSPFCQKAKLMVMALKQQEIGQMREMPNSYDVERLLKLLKESIVTDNELISAKVVTPNILDILRHPDFMRDLPDIRQAIDNSHAECKAGYTDVFFFGIPSTGKTCVLMGMSRSKSLHINLAAAGGEYAAALQQFTDMGKTVPRTPGSFVTTLESTITNSNGSTHRVNLIEMSGEEFAFKIAHNPDQVITFEDMGTGATELLKNDNRKVFFLIIDPTVNVVRINREIQDGYNEETGEPLIRLQPYIVNQRTVMHKLVDLLNDPGNRDIMMKVEAIHIIVTKSDTLGNAVEREGRALDIFRSKYQDDIMDTLVSISEQCNINTFSPNKKEHFLPKLYTFSLGSFYLGGFYEYDQTDSNRLVVAIQNATHPVRKTSLWDKIKKVLN